MRGSRILEHKPPMGDRRVEDTGEVQTGLRFDSKIGVILSVK